jgi:chromosome segregation ATPase
MSIKKRKEELLADLDVAKAGYDSAEVGRLEEEIKKLEAETAEHTEEMKEKTEEVNKEQTMKREELTNMLQDKPENADENADEIIKQAKTRISQTISRYTDKIKEMKAANETDKEKLSKELTDIKAELKKEKNNYQKTKEDFFAKSDYEIKKFTQEDLGKASTKRYRFKVREGKLFNSPKLTKMKTIRRNMTIKKLIKKFNKIGNNEKNGVRFIM